jgi:succinate dehydrogenase / fumarate reductase membrane anchor subunit
MSDSQVSKAKPDYRTPVGRARGLGSAKSGSGHFWWQRVTAILLAVLVPWLVGTLVSFIGADLGTVQMALGKPYNAILFALFAIALFWHAKLGIQVVIEDYVHTRALEVTLQLLVTFACAAGALASLYAIGRIAMMLP